MVRGVLGALAGAGGGAAAWAAVSYFFGLEAGLLAWGLGILAGIGMAWGTEGKGSRGAGVMAALVAVLGIFVGKFVGAHFIAQDWAREMTSAMGEDSGQFALRLQVAQEMEDAGQYMSDAEDGEIFPPEVIAEADRRWRSLSPDEQAALSAEQQPAAETMESGVSIVATVIVFILSFGFFDILWITFAVGSAYRLGRMNSAEREHAAQMAAGGVDLGSSGLPGLGPPVPERMHVPAARPEGAVSGPLARAEERPVSRHVPRSIKVEGFTATGPVDTGETDVGARGSDRQAA
ncbi:MAG: hypothetical protein SFY69_07040 [Planctomycetota bacterium]|nr:hypothetical protein [Planctomycetota bacterium]